MTNYTLGRWLLVALAVVGLVFAAPVVGAHGNDTTAENTTAEDTTAEDTPTDNVTADEWATWMEAHMTEYMGPGAVEWMDSHMGVTVDEMAQDMADDNYNGGMYGQGHC